MFCSTAEYYSHFMQCGVNFSLNYPLTIMSYLNSIKCSFENKNLITGTDDLKKKTSWLSKIYTWDIDINYRIRVVTYTIYLHQGPIWCWKIWTITNKCTITYLKSMTMTTLKTISILEVRANTSVTDYIKTMFKNFKLTSGAITVPSAQPHPWYGTSLVQVNGRS